MGDLRIPSEAVYRLRLVWHWLSFVDNFDITIVSLVRSRGLGSHRTKPDPRIQVIVHHDLQNFLQAMR